MRVCQVCKASFKSGQGFFSHLKLEHSISAQAYYDLFLRKEGDGICKYCGAETEFNRLSRGYYECCSRSCHSKSVQALPGRREAKSEKIRETMKRCNADLAYRKANADRVRGIMSDPSRRRKQSDAMRKTALALHKDPAWALRHSKRHSQRMASYNQQVENTPILRELRVERNRKIMERLWNSETFRANRRIAMARLKMDKNHFEQEVENLLNEICPGLFTYTGNFTHRIGRKFPDFINDEYRLIVEANGSFWHTEEEARDRVALFERLGYATLIIWDYELYGHRETTKRMVAQWLRDVGHLKQDELREQPKAFGTISLEKSGERSNNPKDVTTANPQPSSPGPTNTGEKVQRLDVEVTGTNNTSMSILPPIGSDDIVQSSAKVEVK